ncbi:ERBB receptor feedback inhibitor 1 [Aulostomus maculatus]
MAGDQNNYWGQHDLSRVCLGLQSADMERNLTELRQQQMVKECNANMSCSQSPFYSVADNLLRPHEGDQVVPSSQRWSLFGGHQKEAKPLPPLPVPEELMLDEAADNEVEFFTSDRRRLLPKSCPKAICRGSNRGQVNFAYQESSRDTGMMSSMAFSWPSSEDRSAGRASGFGVTNWTLAPQKEDHQHLASDSLRRKPDKKQTPRHISCSTIVPSEKPQVPPRIPIRPKPAAAPNTGSANTEDKPPKIPPRVPLVPPCPPRSPSPKSLPIYINGVMPATQSFAANPQYVSKALQRQQSESAPPAAQASPCIIPILKDGRQASTTHYILLPPRRPPHTDRRGRLMSEPARTGNAGVWQNR